LELKERLVRSKGLMPLDELSGLDITSLLGITKYEPPVTGSDSFMTGLSAGSFPSHMVSKTDEVRVQSEPGVIQEIWGSPYWITLKCDGTSMTVVRDPSLDKVLVCSRNHAKKDDPEKQCVYWEVARRYGLDRIADDWRKYAIQAEVCGPGIQKNRMGLEERAPFVFNLISLDSRRTLSYPAMLEFCMANGLLAVPLITQGSSFDLTMEQLVEMARGKYPGTDQHREGIVIRSDCYSYVLHGPMSFKVINQDYLLKED